MKKESLRSMTNQVPSSNTKFSHAAKTNMYSMSREFSLKVTCNI